MSPTLCLTTNNTDLFAKQTGVQMTFVGKLPTLTPFDSITYGIRKPEEIFEPLLSNFVTIGGQARVRFSYDIVQEIKNCNSTTGGQPKCLSSFQQACIETMCNCTYPRIEDSDAADLPSQLPGSCVSKHIRGSCGYNLTGLPCPAGLGFPNTDTCTLEQICGSDAGQQVCPLPSCEEPSFPSIATSTPIDRRILDGAVPPAGNESSYLDGVFVLSVVLGSQTITYAAEEVSYTSLSYFGAVGGMMGLLMGFVFSRSSSDQNFAWLNCLPTPRLLKFSVLTIMEWVEGFCRIGKRVEETAVEEIAGVLVDDRLKMA